MSSEHLPPGVTAEFPSVPVTLEVKLLGSESGGAGAIWASSLQNGWLAKCRGPPPKDGACRDWVQKSVAGGWQDGSVEKGTFCQANNPNLFLKIHRESGLPQVVL